MAKQNELIESAFEEAFIKALIDLRSGIAKAGWPQAFRGAMYKARPELLPIVKSYYPNASDQDIENAFATLAFQTMDRIDEGRVTSAELEEIRQEVANTKAPQAGIEPIQHPQPAAFVNAFEKKETETTAPSITSFGGSYKNV